VDAVETSTDLVTWNTIGPAEKQADGSFAFQHVNAKKFPYRYYRIKLVAGQ
jgi:hypothetical protein